MQQLIDDYKGEISVEILSPLKVTVERALFAEFHLDVKCKNWNKF
jgi:hypothetical protein